jgi:hypothetical protein
MEAWARLMINFGALGLGLTAAATVVECVARSAYCRSHRCSCRYAGPLRWKRMASDAGCPFHAGKPDREPDSAPESWALLAIGLPSGLLIFAGVALFAFAN